MAASVTSRHVEQRNAPSGVLQDPSSGMTSVSTAQPHQSQKTHSATCGSGRALGPRRAMSSRMLDSACACVGARRRGGAG